MTTQTVDRIAPAAPARRQPNRSPLFRFWEAVQFVLLAASMLVVVLPIIAITVILVQKGGPAISWEFLTQAPKDRMTAGGIFPVILGTLLLIGGTFVIALPMGVMGALYITEYGRRGRFTRILRLAIVNLAGVPSVVYGLFGLGFFVMFIGGSIDQTFFRAGLPKATFGDGGILWAALTLAMLILPVVITASEEALLSVPDGFRQASLALGATRWQTIRNVVLPSALPGILTGMILGLSRAAGETAPILLVGATFYLTTLPKAFSDRFQALPYHLFIAATQPAEIPEKIPWGTALVLLALVLGMNAVASLFRARARAARRW